MWYYWLSFAIIFTLVVSFMHALYLSKYRYRIRYLHASIKEHYCEFEVNIFIMHVHTLYKVSYINTQYIYYIYLYSTLKLTQLHTLGV